jgi:hypothetical protein
LKEVKWAEEGGRGSKSELTFSLMLSRSGVDLESLECSSAEVAAEKYTFEKYIVFK